MTVIEAAKRSVGQARSLRFFREVELGERSPRGFGLAYRKIDSLSVICCPVPFNWIVWLIREAYWHLWRGPRGGFASELRKLATKKADTAYREGYRNAMKEMGLRDLTPEIVDVWDADTRTKEGRAHKSKQVTAITASHPNVMRFAHEMLLTRHKNGFVHIRHAEAAVAAVIYELERANEKPPFEIQEENQG